MNEDHPDPFRVDPDGLPVALAEWRAVDWTPETVGGELRKIPKRPANPARNAKSNDGSTWGSFDDALRNAIEDDDLGFGFPCAQPGHPFVFLDVDIPDGDEWVPSFDQLGGAVVERSPSGTSRRVILTGCEVPEWWTNQKEKTDDDETREVKIFDNTGYVTLTGDTIDGFGTPLEPTHSPALEQWFKEAWLTFNNDDPKPWKTFRNRETEAGSSGSDPRSNAARTRSATSDEWVDADTAREAFDHIDPDLTRDDWKGVGFALVNHFGTATGGSLFKEWSRGGSKWNKQDAEGIIDGAGEYPHDIRHFVNVAKDWGWDASSAAREAVTATSDGGTSAVNPDPEHAPADTDEDSGMRWELIRDLFRSNENGTSGEAAQGAAKQLLDEDELITIEETDDIWRYNPGSGIFTQDGVARLRKRLADGLNFTYSRSRVADILHRVRSETYAKRESVEAPEDMVCVANGVIDLSDPSDPELLPHSPEYRFTWAMNAKHDPDAEATRFRRFLGGSVRPEDIPKLQEYASDALRHWKQPRNLCVLLGPTDSGKGVFMRVLRATFGDDNVASETLKDLTDTRWGAFSLQHRPINLANELSTGTLDSPEKAKNFSGGGDTINVENKGQSKFEMTPTANHLFATNQVPQVSNADGAFYNRWLFVTFPTSVPTEKQDDTLDTRIVGSEEERAGILNWLIEGYAHRQTRAGTGFDGERSIAEKEDMWSAYGTSIDRFIATCITTDEATNGDAIAKKDAYTVYKTMCNDVGITVESQQKLTTEMNKVEGVGDGKRKVDTHFDNDGQRVLVYTGVQLADDGENYRQQAIHAQETAAAKQATDDGQTGLDEQRSVPSEVSQQRAVTAVMDAIHELTDDADSPVRIDTVCEHVPHTEDRARHIIDKRLKDGSLMEDPEDHIEPTN
jgi:putative DNA primase/helicase